MTRLLCFLFSLLLLSCEGPQAEDQLRQREADLTRREQELTQRENALALREKLPAPPAATPDTLRPLAPADSVRARAFAGTWAVRMNCIEADCPGSAIGDSKSEQWDVSYAVGTFTVRARANNQLTRVYTGALAGSTLELTAQHLPGERLPDAVITVQLQAVDDQHLEGRREINRPAPCRIVYALALTKGEESIR